MKWKFAWTIVYGRSAGQSGLMRLRLLPTQNLFALVASTKLSAFIAVKSAKPVAAGLMLSKIPSNVPLDDDKCQITIYWAANFGIPKFKKKSFHPQTVLHLEVPVTWWRVSYGGKRR